MSPRTLISAAVLCLTAACNTTESARVGRLDSPVTLAAGDKYPMPGHGSLRYVGVREDSRCPPAVNCIRAGDARVDFELTGRNVAVQRLTIVYPDQATGRLGALTVGIDALDFAQPPRVTVRLQGR